MEQLGLSQTQLAQVVGVSQPAIHALITRNKTGSRQLHKIARALQTTPAYLEGDIDDPHEGAPPPPPPPTVQFVTLDVAFPSTPALAAMFSGLLASVEDLDLSRDELALELATLLPTGLAQLRGQLRSTAKVGDDAGPALLETAQGEARERRRA
jgi:transcriptional regulator with XRE-family HTH domain